MNKYDTLMIAKRHQSSLSAAHKEGVAQPPFNQLIARHLVK